MPLPRLFDSIVESLIVVPFQPVSEPSIAIGGCGDGRHSLTYIGSLPQKRLELHIFPEESDISRVQIINRMIHGGHDMRRS